MESFTIRHVDDSDDNDDATGHHPFSLISSPSRTSHELELFHSREHPPNTSTTRMITLRWIPKSLSHQHPKEGSGRGSVYSHRDLTSSGINVGRTLDGKYFYHHIHHHYNEIHIVIVITSSPLTIVHYILHNHHSHRHNHSH